MANLNTPLQSHEGSVLHTILHELSQIRADIARVEAHGRVVDTQLNELASARARPSAINHVPPENVSLGGHDEIGGIAAATTNELGNVRAEIVKMQGHEHRVNARLDELFSVQARVTSSVDSVRVGNLRIIAGIDTIQKQYDVLVTGNAEVRGAFNALNAFTQQVNCRIEQLVSAQVSINANMRALQEKIDTLTKSAARRNAGKEVEVVHSETPATGDTIPAREVTPNENCEDVAVVFPNAPDGKSGQGSVLGYDGGNGKVRPNGNVDENDGAREIERVEEQARPLTTSNYAAIPSLLNARCDENPTTLLAAKSHHNEKENGETAAIVVEDVNNCAAISKSDPIAPRSSPNEPKQFLTRTLSRNAPRGRPPHDSSNVRMVWDECALLWRSTTNPSEVRRVSTKKSNSMVIGDVDAAAKRRRVCPIAPEPTVGGGGGGSSGGKVEHVGEIGKGDDDGAVMMMKRKRQALLNARVATSREKLLFRAQDGCSQIETVLIHQIKSLLDLTSLSQDFLADTTEVSHSDLDSYLRCKYNDGVQDELEKKLLAFVDNYLDGKYDVCMAAHFA